MIILHQREFVHIRRRHIRRKGVCGMAGGIMGLVHARVGFRAMFAHADKIP